MLREIQLGSEAEDYLRQYLANGGSLARRLSALQFAIGRVVTWLPENVSSEDALRFRAAHLVHRTQAIQAASEYIEMYLTQGPQHCAIFEDLLTKPKDPGLKDDQLPWFHSDDEVYYYLLASKTQGGEVSRTIRTTYTFRFLCALTDWPTDLSLTSDRGATVQFLDSLASATASIVVGAYDGEGFLMWRRDTTATT